MVRVKPIWSADNRANILAYIADGPVYQPLKRLMNISTLVCNIVDPSSALMVREKPLAIPCA